MLIRLGFCGKNVICDVERQQCRNIKKKRAHGEGLSGCTYLMLQDFQARKRVGSLWKKLSLVLSRHGSAVARDPDLLAIFQIFPGADLAYFPPTISNPSLWIKVCMVPPGETPAALGLELAQAARR